MIRLTTEQARQIEEVLLDWEDNFPNHWDLSDKQALATIRAAKAQEPAEQDLDTCPGCGGVADNGHDREFPPNPYYCTKCTEQVEHEPVAIADGTFNHNCPLGTPLYAAPVRTKDLTDDEIEDVCCRLWSGGWRKKAMNDFARAVIEKFKEKNK